MELYSTDHNGPVEDVQGLVVGSKGPLRGVDREGGFRTLKNDLVESSGTTVDIHS